MNIGTLAAFSWMSISAALWSQPARREPIQVPPRPGLRLCMLPQEIICMVFEHMLPVPPGAKEQRWMASLAHVCRDVGPAAQRTLYRAPYIYDITALALFLRTLNDRPDLARQVTELILDHAPIQSGLYAFIVYERSGLCFVC
jgi:hypothetical protein